MEQVLFRQLVKNEELGGFLADYQGRPALFYQKAPSTEDLLWESSCFPRVEFVVDRSYDPERKESGKLWFHVWVSSDNLSITGGNLERDIEKCLIEKVDGVFYRENEGITCATWVNSMTFQGRTSDKNMETSPVETYGVTLEFDLIEFPQQVTTDPDPVQGANRWMKTQFPSVTVLGLDDLPTVWKPSPDKLAVYWRFMGYEGDDRQSFSVNWYTGKLALHFFAESVATRNQWLKVVVEALQLDGEIILLDESPMFLKKVVVIHSGNSLREGQLQLLGEYGVLASQRKEKAEYLLKNAYFRKGEEHDSRKYNRKRNKNRNFQH